MSKRRIFSLVLAGVVVAVMLVPGGAVKADPANLNRLLKGDYAFSGHATCLTSPGGFSGLAPVGPPAPFPTVASFSIQGVRTFNGDGTGTVVARSVGINHPFALPTTPTPVFNRGSAFATDVQASFTYEVAPDRTFTLETPLVNLTSVAPAAGNLSTITNLPVFTGEISKDGRTLTIHHENPGVETVTPTSPSGSAFDRICTRSRILLELKN